MVTDCGWCQICNFGVGRNVSYFGCNGLQKPWRNDCVLRNGRVRCRHSDLDVKAPAQKEVFRLAFKGSQVCRPEVL